MNYRALPSLPRTCPPSSRAARLSASLLALLVLVALVLWPRLAAAADVDNDQVEDTFDNCGSTYNPDQHDSDTDGTGDLCDSDADGDSTPAV